MQFKFFQTIFLLIFIFICSQSIIPQEKELTFDQVYLFRPPQLLAPLPNLRGWLDDNHYLEQKSENGNTLLYSVNAVNGSEEIFLNYSAYDSLLIDGFTLDNNDGHTDDYDGFLFNKDNDLWYFSVNGSVFKQLTNDEAEEKNPTFSPDGKKIAYTKNRDLYVVDVNTAEEIRLTYDASESVYNGWASWVYYEEILGRASHYKAFWWAPNSKMIAFLRTDDSPVPKFPLYRADGVHGELEWEYYPKAGDPNPDVKLGVAHLSDKKIVWCEEDENIDQYTAWPFFTSDSRQLFYQVVNRGQDTLQFLSADPFTGVNRTIYTETQSSWVEFFENESFYLFKNGSGFLIRSDKDGWRHLYYYDLKGNLQSRLTDGEWVVSNIELVDEEDSKVYFTGSKESSLENHLYVVNLDGTGLKQLTSSPGTHRVSVSPGGSFFYDIYTSTDTPHKVELFDSNGESVRFIADRKTKEFESYNLGKTELFTITTSDGVELPAMWVLPPDFDESKKYPVLYSVYGGPGGKDVSNSFSAFFDRYFIAQSGIIYFSVDHRGSAHFGKIGTSQMHRNLGKWEINDYIEAVKWLEEKPFVMKDKIAITGGSYGGYVTCLALTLGSDYFDYGIAEYSVTDYRLYDNVYTERYMDTPEENPEGYEQGSAITHADKYKGYLLLTHGTMDDNVHMQNTIQLVDKFTDLDKDFELMLYPNARHGVGFPKWKHVRREQIQFWYRHLLGKEFKY